MAEETREAPERPPSNSYGDWPFMRKPVRVPEVLVVGREHLPQLENIQEVLHSRRDVSEVSQSYPTLRDPMDCSLLGSPVLGIFQARVLEWVAISFSNYLVKEAVI